MESFATDLINMSQFTALVKSFIAKFSENHCKEMFKSLARKPTENKSSFKMKDG